MLILFNSSFNRICQYVYLDKGTNHDFMGGRYLLVNLLQILAS